MFTFHSEAVCLTNLVTPFHKCLWSIIYLEPNATAALFVTYFETEATCVMSRKIAKEQMKTIFRIECCTHIAYTVNDSDIFDLFYGQRKFSWKTSLLRTFRHHENHKEKRTE